MSAGIEDEPALAGITFADAAGADPIGGEAALADEPEAMRDRERTEERLRMLWSRPPRSGAALRFAVLCAASGAFAVLCALAKGALGFGLLAVAVGAPVVEETAKAILPLMCLEKEPWTFRSAGAIVLACLVSAFVFATIENLLYFFVYIPREKLTEGIIRYRLIVCTLMHVGSTAVSACGLARAWRDAKAGMTDFSAATVTPYLFAAMAIHGLYNAAAAVFSLVE